MYQIYSTKEKVKVIYFPSFEYTLMFMLQPHKNLFH